MPKSKINDRVVGKPINLDDIFDDGWMFSMENPSLSGEAWIKALEQCLVSEENETGGGISMKYDPIYRMAKKQCQKNLLKELIGQVLLYHFIRNETFYIDKSEYPELVNREFSITDEMLSDGEVSKIASLNDNYALPEDLRDRAIFLVQNYLEEKALDTEPELHEIYQRIP
jgi:hypothetical protein